MGSIRGAVVLASTVIREFKKQNNYCILGKFRSLAHSAVQGVDTEMLITENSQQPHACDL